MNRSVRLKTIAIVLLSGVLCSAKSIAQNQNTTTWEDFGFIKYSNPWLTGYNASGLKVIPVDKISIAEVFGSKGNGGFRNFYQSDNDFEFGALTESFYRLNPRVVFYGRMSYNHFIGKNMTGSAFIDPYYHPFDLLESDENNSGKKVKETYQLAGSVSAQVYKQLVLGASVDYTAANYAKQKDLRHKNKLLDLKATVGFSAQLFPSLEVGANYYYRRSVEGVEFGTYGNTDVQYYSLVSYGAFYGNREYFGDTGYTKKDQEKPMFNEFHGASLQLNINFNQSLEWFNEFTFKVRDGYYGKRSPSTVVYSQHNSNILEYNGTFSYKANKNLHTLKLNFDYENLDNYENVYRTEAQPGGNYDIIYYDKLKTTDRKVINARIKYTGAFGVENFNPKWTLCAEGHYFNRKQTVSIYPFYRKQSINYTDIKLAAYRNLVKGDNMYSLMLGVSYRMGNGTAKDDGLYATPSENQKEPQSGDNYIFKELEYLTNNRFTGDLGFKYSRLFTSSIRGYAAIDCQLIKASDIVYLEDDKHFQATLRVGCVF